MSALKLTRNLLQFLQKEPVPGEAVRSASIGAILRSGSVDDASVICNHFVAAAGAFEYYELLEVLRRWGNVEHGKRIFEAVMEDDRLKEAIDPVVLEIVGVLGYLPAREVLVEYAYDQKDYYLHKHAALGLLGLDCTGLEEKISKEIEGIYGKNLFPEFTPVLVSKLHNRGDKLRKLYETGKFHASTDCNAGILLGFSLSGKEGKDYFLKALFDPAWEALSTATGSRTYAFRGVLKQNLSFVDLFAEMEKEGRNGNAPYALIVFLSLLEESVFNLWNYRLPESFTRTYEGLFGGKDDRLLNLAGEHHLEDEVLRIEELLRLKVHEEISLGTEKFRWNLT